MPYNPASVPVELSNRSAFDGFKPKLSYSQRCQAYGLRTLGFTTNIIADLFGLNKATVGHICNPASQHYKAVRREASSMDEEAFRQKYLNDALIAKAWELQRAVTKPGPTALPPNNDPNPRASARAGRRSFSVMGLDVDIEVEWLDDARAQPKPAGWFWRDLDNPDTWCGPFLNSHNAERAAKSLDQAARDI